MRDKVSEKVGGKAICQLHLTMLHIKTCIVISYFTPKGRKRTHCTLLR